MRTRLHNMLIVSVMLGGGFSMATGCDEGTASSVGGRSADPGAVDPGMQGNAQPNIANPPPAGNVPAVQPGKLFADQDAYGNSCNFEANYGTDYSIATGVQEQANGTDCFYTGFIKFPVHFIPAGARVNYAIMKLTTFPSANDVIGTTTIAAVDGTSWSENVLTYVNMPSFAHYVMSKPVQFGFTDIHVESFDITAAVQAWVDGDLVNRGLMIRTRNLPGAGSEARFYSSEWGANRPFLEFEYEK